MAEERVMLVLWKLQQGFLKDILYNSPGPKPHSNTIATILKILVEKGFVVYETKGRNNLYRPVISKYEYGKNSINQLIRNYFEDSPSRLVFQLINDGQLSEEEQETMLTQLRKRKDR